MTTQTADELKPDSTNLPSKQRRGFASLSPERRREIASRAGRIAHALGHAHEYTSEEARAAGRKGGLRVSQDREHMAEIGSSGGQQWARARSARREIGS